MLTEQYSQTFGRSCVTQQEEGPAILLKSPAKFGVGDHVAIIEGKYSGKSGIVLNTSGKSSRMIHHFFPYGYPPYAESGGLIERDNIVTILGGQPNQILKVQVEESLLKRYDHPFGKPIEPESRW